MHPNPHFIQKEKGNQKPDRTGLSGTRQKHYRGKGQGTEPRRDQGKGAQGKRKTKP